MDDIWASSDEDSAANTNLRAETQDMKKLREVHSQRGYLDGIVSSKETNLQQGFDQGFPTGAQLGMRVGEIIGTLYTLDHTFEDQEIQRNLNEALTELTIIKVLHKRAFDPEYELMDQKHQTIRQWEAKVKQLKSKLYANDVNAKSM